MPDMRRMAARMPLAVAGAVALAVVLLVHGFVPGLITDGPWDYLLEGDMRCLDQLGAHALTSWCHAYGQPLGYPFLSSGPLAFAGWAFMEVTGLGSYAGYLFAGALFDATALAGGYGLLRTLGTGRVVALIGALAYLLSPTVVGMGGFGGTFSGVALLPAYALLDLWLIRAFERGDRTVIAMVAAGYVAAKTCALFMDGYSFVFWALISAALWAWPVLRPGVAMRRRIVQAGTVVGASAVAVASYWLYVPAVADASPMDVFRSMGLDLSTLVLPTHYVWVFDLVGATSDHTTLWGDGTNSAYNYVGVVGLGLAGVGLVMLRRRPQVVALAAAGAIAFGLSLGPSLKIDDVRGPAQTQPTSQSYMMPTGRATVDFPWYRVYRVPGVANMRATYRWSAVTRFALVVLAALAVDRLMRRTRWRMAAGALAVLALVETAPNVPLLVSEHRDFYDSRGAMRASVVGDLQAATRPGESVFFLSPDGIYNDYLANFLVPTARLTSFNAGGDKNALLTRDAWPRPIAAVSRPQVDAGDVVRALESGDVDVVIAPLFHLRWAAYSWPPPQSGRRAARRRFARLVDDPRLNARVYPWFTTLRLPR
jgi:hypothetical protein